jgi:hypothetical protein
MVPFTEELRSRLEPTLSALSDAESPEDPSDRKARLCVLAAGLLHQEQPVRLLSNLRSGEFGYNAYLKEVLLAGRALGPLLMLTLLVCLLGIAGSYALREYQIGRLESAVRAKVTEVLQDDSISPGDELNRLQAEITAVQAQLNAMGSQAGISALDVLIELHKDLAGGAVNFRKVSIRDSRIELLGRAPRLSNIEEIETTLNQKRIGPEAARMYCRVKPVKQTSVGTPGAPAYDFQLDLRLCE